jgi:hypothetical protein
MASGRWLQRRQPVHRQPAIGLGRVDGDTLLLRRSLFPHLVNSGLAKAPHTARDAVFKSR